VGVALEQERRDRAEQINTDGHHDDRHEGVAQPTMRGCSRAENITKLARTDPTRSGIGSIVARATDVCAVRVGRRCATSIRGRGGPRAFGNRSRRARYTVGKPARKRSSS
jgi:hypothetical protein